MPEHIPDTKGGLYAIVDKVAQDIAGPITFHKHPATAVRLFTDVISQEGTIVSKHPDDYELVRLGYLTHDHDLIPARETILTGAAWKASRES